MLIQKIERLLMLVKAFKEWLEPKKFMVMLLLVELRLNSNKEHLDLYLFNKKKLIELQVSTVMILNQLSIGGMRPTEEDKMVENL